MPLSEHEQRQFEAIERALYADDPKFAQSVRRREPAVAGRRRLALAIVIAVIGLGALLAGVVTSLTYVGVAGFLVMVGAALLGAYAVRLMAGRTRRATPAAAAGGGSVTSLAGRRRSRQRRSGGGGIIARLEERWQRRQGEQGF